MDTVKPTDKEPGRIPSPSCKALLLCDQTIVEAMTGKVSIIGTFERFTIRSAPSHLAPFHVFVQLVEGVGRYDIIVEVHDLRNDAVIARAPAIGVQWTEKLQKLNVLIPVPPLPVQHTGSYDLVVFANAIPIDRQRFEVVALAEMTDGDNPKG